LSLLLPPDDIALAAEHVCVSGRPARDDMTSQVTATDSPILELGDEEKTKKKGKHLYLFGCLFICLFYLFDFVLLFFFYLRI
jgi:hypothetical protein